MAEIFKRAAPALLAFLILCCIAVGIANQISETQKEPNKGSAYLPDWASTVTTTNATPTNIASFALATGQTMRIVVDIIGSSGNNRFRGRKTCCVKNISGTLSIVGAQVFDIIDVASDAGLATAGFTISTSGTNVIVPVTGIAATTILWNSNITYIVN